MILSCETFLLGASLGTALGVTNLVQLLLLWGSLGASLTALGASLGAVGRVFGVIRELLGASSAHQTLYFGEFGPALETSPIKRASAETCTIKEREARQ